MFGYFFIIYVGPSTLKALILPFSFSMFYLDYSSHVLVDRNMVSAECENNVLLLTFLNIFVSVLII